LFLLVVLSLPQFPDFARREEVVAVPTQRASSPVVYLAEDAVATGVDTSVGTVDEAFFSPPPETKNEPSPRAFFSAFFAFWRFSIGKQVAKQLS